MSIQENIIKRARERGLLEKMDEATFIEYIDFLLITIASANALGLEVSVKSSHKEN